MCLGHEPGAAGWKAQVNPLSYGGTPCQKSLAVLLLCRLKIERGKEGSKEFEAEVSLYSHTDTRSVINMKRQQQQQEEEEGSNEQRMLRTLFADACAFFIARTKNSFCIPGVEYCCTLDIQYLPINTFIIKKARTIASRETWAQSNREIENRFFANFVASFFG